ncbi:pentapeptide repeat-containing protein [Sphaerospermopsis sp. LEGE 00249]|uniref:pentapeptide repeat-containing protein n=1 Tax=Sphaerospermopsis sp. LEGE 00249 TaxID=1380707 RepID=UPI00164D7363|nr:pentapeptide repeat-containing protein [Sphaerospermopsis sp. LEGE 00249]MBC5794941.1 pentapeptide repeat-containing protein [Sphaerospermopsis sp. LEGE 00249]
MLPDYSGQNLRGRSFKGQNLTKANFRKADLRGADFTNAILKCANFTNANLKGADFTGADLTGANFSYAKAGLKFHWIFILLALSFIISSLSGFTSAIIITFNIYFWFSKKLTAIFVIPYSIIFISIVRTILNNYFEPFAITINIYLSIGVILAVAFFGAPAAAVDEPDAKLGGMALVTFTGMVFLIVIVFNQMGGLVENLLTNIGDIKVQKIIKDFGNGQWFGGIVGGIFGAVWGYFFSNAAIECDQKFAWIWKMCVNFTAKGGTIFTNTNLTEANFTKATLKNTDFRKANLTRTRFYEAKKLDFARPGNTILANPAVLNLLVTLNGRNKSYVGANLRGANLIGADLTEANLKDADIIEATFQAAYLEWANLSFTQAVGTNFTHAQMTGACLEAWNIESTTVLDNVDCRFVYLLENPKPKTNDRERRPSSGEFQPGEFTKLFEEVLNTVDFIFRNGINWQAFFHAFGKVQNDNEDTELSIQSIGNKGDGVVVVKVAVSEGADKEKIHGDFNQNYKLALAAIEEKYKAELQAKDNEIVIYRQQSADMTEIVKLLANQPINVQVDNKVENKNMTNSNDFTRNVEVEMNIKEATGVAGKVMGDQIINPKPNLADSAGEIQQLLQILNQSYPADIPTDTQAEIEVAVKGINKNPQMKERVIGALKAGGIEAIKEFADNLYVNVLIAAYDGWKNPQS